MWRLGAMPFLEWQMWMFWLLLANTSGYGQHYIGRIKENFHFTQQVYNGTVPESAVGKVYVKTSIKMGIFLPDLSLKVDFSILGKDEGNIFHAESITVEDFCFLLVRTKTGAYGMLNREHRQMYYLQIQATGSLLAGPELKAFTDLNITLLDQNEFSPLFPTTPFSVSIPEDTPVHSSIAEVKASDAEVGINGEIYYSFVKWEPLFAVHPTSGVVTLMRPLMFQRSNYRLEIHAEDRGLKSLDRLTSPLSNTYLEVNVLPVNYHSPIILVQQFSTLLEDTNLGSIFAVLKVTDPDVGRNGEILSVDILDNKIFHAVSTSTSSVFNVVVSSYLDREKEPEGLNITVIAVDNGQPRRSATVIIPVRIQDVNDNAPVFQKELYKTELLEVVPIQTPVLFVSAMDADEGLNGKVCYWLKDNSISELFSIDETTGLISTAGQLDAEVDQQIILTVYAEDNANSGTRLTGETKVIINIKDFNDNVPKFYENNLSDVFVNENMPKGTSVVTITATDSDAGDNSQVSYSIHNIQKVPFEIDAFTGEIQTAEVFDFETMRKQFVLIVRASDWGSPYKHGAEQQVIINIRDINDNSPEFEKTHCKGYLSKEAAIGTEIIVLTAIDFDAGNIISYSIAEGNEDNCFVVEPSTGALQVTCELTSYSGDSRVITVIASDGEHISVPTTVTLKLVNSKKANSQPPQKSV